MQETEGLFAFFRQGIVMLARGFEQAVCADDVGLDEVFGAVDGAVHMAFGCKVDDSTDGVFLQEGGYKPEVADVALDEAVAVVFFKRGEVLPVAGVGELVQVDDGFV